MSLTIAAGGFALPALVAGAVYFVLRRYAPAQWIQQNAASAALVVGFLVGYAMLDVAPWRPKFYWHWLPYVALLSLIPSFAFSLPGGDANKRRVIGASLCLLVTCIAAWLLVPTWPHLDPSRNTYLAVWTICVFALAMLLEPMIGRLPGTISLTVLAGTMLAATVLILLSEGLRTTLIAGAATGPMLGIVIAHRLGRRAEVSRGIAATFAILISSLLLVAQADSHSNVPLVSYFLIPLAPLGLWMVVVPCIAKIQGWRRWVALSAVPLITLIVAIGLAAWKTLL